MTPFLTGQRVEGESSGHTLVNSKSLKCGGTKNYLNFSSNRHATVGPPFSDSSFDRIVGVEYVWVKWSYVDIITLVNRKSLKWEGTNHSISEVRAQNWRGPIFKLGVGPTKMERGQFPFF